MKLTGEGQNVSCVTGFSFDLKCEGRGGHGTKLKQIRIILVTCCIGDWIFKWFFKDRRRMHLYKLA